MASRMLSRSRVERASRSRRVTTSTSLGSILRRSFASSGRSYPKDLRVLPGHPEPAVSWHSGFRGGAHARPKTTPVHHAARRRGGVAARGACAAGDSVDDWISRPQGHGQIARREKLNGPRLLFVHSAKAIFMLAKSLRVGG